MKEIEENWEKNLNTKREEENSFKIAANMIEHLYTPLQQMAGDNRDRLLVHYYSIYVE